MIQVAETNRRLAELHHRLARIQQEDIVLKCFRFNKKNLESRFGGLGSLELGLIVEKNKRGDEPGEGLCSIECSAAHTTYC